MTAHAPCPAARRPARPYWALADQCIVSAANFFSVLAFARGMSTESFGAFAVALTALLLLTSMQGALLVQPHNVLAATLGDAEYRRFTAALAAAQLLFGTAACAAIALASWIVTHVAQAGGPGGTMFALALAAWPWMAQEFVRRVLYTRSDARAAFANDLLTYGLQLAGAGALLAWGGGRADASHALAIYGLSSLAGTLAGGLQLRSHFAWAGGRPGWMRRAWSEAWNFGKWLTAQNLLVWFGAQGHAWIVATLLGTGHVGLYRAAMHLVNITNPLRQAAFAYLPSRGSAVVQREGLRGLHRWVRRLFWVLLCLQLPLCLVLIAFAQPMLAFFYGPRYAGADLAWILALATIAQLFTFVKFPFDVGLLAMRVTKSIFLVHIVPVLLLFTSGVTLVRLLGIEGVPWSAMTINVVLFASTVVIYFRRMRQAASPSPATRPGRVGVDAAAG